MQNIKLITIEELTAQLTAQSIVNDILSFEGEEPEQGLLKLLNAALTVSRCETEELELVIEEVPAVAFLKPVPYTVLACGGALVRSGVAFSCNAFAERHHKVSIICKRPRNPHWAVNHVIDTFTI